MRQYNNIKIITIILHAKKLHNIRIEKEKTAKSGALNRNTKQKE